MATETIALGFNRDLPDYKTCPKLLIGQKAVVTLECGHRQGGR